MGRTGTIAGRLLVEFGVTSGDAIKAIRLARARTIETRKQEEYVKNCKPLASAWTPRSREEKALAALLGGAVGDAFGYDLLSQRPDKALKICSSIRNVAPAMPVLVIGRENNTVLSVKLFQADADAYILDDAAEPIARIRSAVRRSKKSPIG